MPEELEPQTILVMFKNIDEKLDEIHDQTKKTNGRVNSLEVWRGFITGGLALLTVLVLPIIFKLFFQ